MKEDADSVVLYPEIRHRRLEAVFEHRDWPDIATYYLTTRTASQGWAAIRDRTEKVARTKPSILVVFMSAL